LAEGDIKGAKNLLTELFKDDLKDYGPDHPNTMASLIALVKGIMTWSPPSSTELEKIESYCSGARSLLAQRADALGFADPAVLALKKATCQLLAVAGKVQEAMALHSMEGGMLALAHSPSVKNMGLLSSQPTSSSSSSFNASTSTFNPLSSKPPTPFMGSTSNFGSSGGGRGTPSGGAGADGVFFQDNPMRNSRGGGGGDSGCGWSLRRRAGQAPRGVVGGALHLALELDRRKGVSFVVEPADRRCTDVCGVREQWSEHLLDEGRLVRLPRHVGAGVGETA
jgi:hypothetical protein